MPPSAIACCSCTTARCATRPNSREDPSVSLTSFVVCRNWASNRLRALLSVLGVAFGVAIVVAIYVMDHNTIRSRQLAKDPQRGPDELEVVAMAPQYDVGTV